MKINFLITLLIFIFSLTFSSAHSKGPELTKLKKTDIKTIKNGKETQLYITSTAPPQIKLWQRYLNQRLIEQKIDTNADGKYDQHDHWPEDTPRTEAYMISKKYDAAGKLMQKKKFLYDEQMDFNVVLTYESPEIEKVSFADYLPKFHGEAEGPCHLAPLELDQVLSKLTREVDQANLELTDGFYLTDFGAKVHKSCTEKWNRPPFLKSLKESMKVGAQCLNDLARDSKTQGTTPLTRLYQLKGMWETDDVAFICHEEDYNWPGTAAHASTGPDNEIEELGVSHPYVSINPTTPDTSPTDKIEVQDLKRTLFHEQLHNLGIPHGEGVESIYTCSECCFPEERDNRREKLTTLSCKICQGDYQDEFDPEYLKDMIEWTKAGGNQNVTKKAVLKNLKRSGPGDLEALLLYAQTQENAFTPIGTYLVKAIKDEGLEIPEQFKQLEENTELNLNYSVLNSEQKKAAEVVSGALFDLYYKGDPESSLSKLESEADLVKKVVEGSKDESSVMAEQVKWENIRENVKQTIYEIWVNKYKTQDDSKEDIQDRFMRGYRLVKKTNL